MCLDPMHAVTGVNVLPRIVMHDAIAVRYAAQTKPGTHGNLKRLCSDYTPSPVLRVPSGCVNLIQSLVRVGLSDEVVAGDGVEFIPKPFVDEKREARE
eukprot:4757186-Amphidinium_carterae.1